MSDFVFIDDQMKHFEKIPVSIIDTEYKNNGLVFTVNDGKISSIGFEENYIQSKFEEKILRMNLNSFYGVGKKQENENYCIITECRLNKNYICDLLDCRLRVVLDQ